MNNKHPQKRIRRGQVVASIWANETKDGKRFYTTTVECSYPKKDGTTGFGSSFSTGQLVQLERVAKLADFAIEQLMIRDSV